ncbi:MAG: DUF1858 domain-containing protein [Chloroflexi bacterium]|jgi:uncharacterized protein|nr:DUF1858 domain-containing protein [Chloroflexota bacterium]MBT7080114.1 DUF1858 domain-containing protein [Chloroflexota bacterium]MBT7290192.1 DUF1858 domain-containing protein [Chloroflexota bacterium]
MKELDLNQSVYALTKKYPELIDTLKELGFAGIVNPLVRRTLGRKMTIPKGCDNQKKDLNEVIKTLESAGYSVKQ